MDNQWVSEKLRRLKRLHTECGMQEVALSRYISCMIRMLNGLAQMEYSEFYFYEKQILWDAFKIFTEHFIEQIEVAKCELNVKEKRKLIDDIENAVDSMTGVYKNVIDSTANSDRQMLSSISIDTSIYQLSPKLCAFYSLILNKLVKMFEEDSGKYAFLLHPTLKNNTETKVMFERRATSGKVVIIYISESIIEMFDVVSVFIMHEAFHVLTKRERMRKKRTESFIKLMIAGMKQVLFENVVFDEQEGKNTRIADELLRRFFSDWRKEVAIWENEKEDSREFYSSSVKQWGNGYFEKSLKNINGSLELWVNEIISREFSGESYSEFKINCEKEDSIINQVRKNLADAMYENKAKSLAERFLFICREVYADIACILTLQLKPVDYQKAFEESKQFRSDEKYNDSTRTIRNYIVALSVSNHMPAEENKMWKDYATRLYDILSKNCEERNGIGKSSTFSKTYVMLDITPQMRQALSEYAQGCAQMFSDRVEAVEDIESFRKYMWDVRDCSKKDLLMKNIMVGDFDRIL